MPAWGTKTGGGSAWADSPSPWAAKPEAVAKPEEPEVAKEEDAAPKKYSVSRALGASGGSQAGINGTSEHLFPSLEAATETKKEVAKEAGGGKKAATATKEKKKKKGATLSLADFNAVTESAPKSFSSNSMRGDSSWNDDILMNLPTAPTAKFEGEDGAGIGGAFNDYGGDRFANRDRGFGDRDRDDRRRGGFGFNDRDDRMDDEFGDAPSRADDDDNWGKSKKFEPSGDRGYGGGYDDRRDFDDHGPPRSKADDEDDWGRGKSFEPTPAGGFGREDDGFGTSSKADEMDDWGREKKFVPSSEYDDRRESPRYRSDAEMDWSKREVLPTEPNDTFGGSKADAADDWSKKKEPLPPLDDRDYGPRISKADAADDWSKSKEELPPRADERDFGPRVSKADAVDDWARGKEERPSPTEEYGRPREFGAPRSDEDWNREKRPMPPGREDRFDGGAEERRERWTFNRERPGDVDERQSWRSAASAAPAPAVAEMHNEQPPRERPQLKLKAKSASSGGDEPQQSRSSLFGGARPREEKLKEMGRDYIKEDEKMTRAVPRKETAQERKLHSFIRSLRARVDAGEGEEIYVSKFIAEATASGKDEEAGDGTLEEDGATDSGAKVKTEQRPRNPITVAQKLALTEEKLSKLSLKLDEGEQGLRRSYKLAADGAEKNGRRGSRSERAPPVENKATAPVTDVVGAAPAESQPPPQQQQPDAPSTAKPAGPRAWRDIASASASEPSNAEPATDSVAPKESAEARTEKDDESKVEEGGWSEVVRSDKKNKKPVAKEASKKPPARENGGKNGDTRPRGRQADGRGNKEKAEGEKRGPRRAPRPSGQRQENAPAAASVKSK